MSLDVLLGLTAVANRRAVPRASQRHVHLAGRPFVVVGYHVPGDPGSPLGILCGDRRDQPRVIAAGEPRAYDERWRTLTEFALDLNGYLGRYAMPSAPSRRNGRSTVRTHPVIPQLVVPNADTAQWLCQELGLLLRYLQPERDQRINPALPVAGAHLSFFDQQRVPGASLVLAMTEVLALHWKTGQLPSMDSHLASQMAWIRRPETILEAENALPAGPVPDPEWERDKYTRSTKVFNQLRGVAGRPGDAIREASKTVREALEPAWEAVWESLDAVGELLEAEHVAERAGGDEMQWHRHAERVRGNRAYFRRRPRQLQVFRYLNRLERLTGNLDRQMALDDPQIMARHVASGDALSGTVVKVLPEGTGRQGRRQPRPILHIRPDLPFARPLGTHLWFHCAVETSRAGTPVRPTVELEVTGLNADGIVELTVISNAIRREHHRRLPLPDTGQVFAPFEPPTFRPDAIPDVLPWTHREPEED